MTDRKIVTMREAVTSAMRQIEAARAESEKLQPKTIDGIAPTE
ncbi:hypothetical protein [Paracoccus versutus]|uniref:Uncharacterized protein n=1 Tax=Paracoccus versutus TaxID=34007 RepID=A0A3D9XIY5_PARVE|nr:hypothetical protein [Paracoccus versutus]REF70390.1 hypothetical protein BDD41_3122 [Paracoccus versutus]